MSSDVDVKAAGEEGGGGGRKEQAISMVLDNLEADITCHICIDQYREPKLLPCGHYFCRRCIGRVSETARGKPLSCPVCSKATTLPAGGVNGLPSAYFVERLLDVHRTINANKEELRPRRLMCDVCKRGHDVSNFCKECDQFLCTGCNGKHASSAIYAGHRVMSLDELRAKRQGSVRSASFLVRSDSTASYAGRFASERAPPTNSVADDNDKTKVYAMCPKHPDERIKVYCHDHDAVICRDCTVYDHPIAKCRTGFIKDEAPKARTDLRDALFPVLSDQESLAAAERDLDAVHKKISADADDQTKEIRESFREIRKRMEVCEETMLGAVAAFSEGKKESLQSQKKAIQFWKQEVEGLIKGIETDLEQMSDEDILLAHKEIFMKIEKEIYQHRMRTLEPVTNADLAKIGPSPDNVPKKLGLVYPRLELFQLKIRPPSVIQVGTKVMYPLELPHSIGGDIKVEVQSVIDPGCVIKADVVLKKDREEGLRKIIIAKYVVSFTPRIRGDHNVSVKVNEQELPGSPFLISCRIHPHHLGAIVYQTKADVVVNPYTVSFSSDGLVLCTGNKSKKIHFLTKDLQEKKDGKELKAITCQLFHYPRGLVCSNQPGVVYMTDKGTEKGYGNYTIMKFVDGHLDKGTVHKSRTLRLIKLINGQLFVADESFGEVHRFSADTLDHIASFSVSSKPSNVHDIAEHNGQLFVLGGTKIAVYSLDDWRFLYTVPLSIQMVHMRGICFDKDGYMFLTQGGGGARPGVFVFDPKTGNFITSFGHFMAYPVGIAISEDGFVYVADHHYSVSKVYAF